MQLFNLLKACSTIKDDLAEVGDHSSRAGRPNVSLAETLASAACFELLTSLNIEHNKRQTTFIFVTTFFELRIWHFNSSIKIVKWMWSWIIIMRKWFSIVSPLDWFLEVISYYRLYRSLVVLFEEISVEMRIWLLSLCGCQ